MNRRMFLASASAVALARPVIALSCGFEVCRSEAEWRTADGERVPRPPGRGNGAEKRSGTYQCRGCALPVYASDAKYDSGTGLPSFFESLPDSIRTREDHRLIFQVRTEVHCRRCGSHPGHVFDDGPAPTGKGHCLNGLSLEFVTA